MHACLLCDRSCYLQGLLEMGSREAILLFVLLAVIISTLLCIILHIWNTPVSILISLLLTPQALPVLLLQGSPIP